MITYTVARSLGLTGQQYLFTLAIVSSLLKFVLISYLPQMPELENVHAALVIFIVPKL